MLRKSPDKILYTIPVYRGEQASCRLRARLSLCCSSCQPWPFQSTPSWRGRPNTAPLLPIVVNFNPRPREEGDIRTRSDHFREVTFQSTPSWSGRRHSAFDVSTGKVISIHALVKRATLNKQIDYLLQLISIHALVKRATFNHSVFIAVYEISIHTLVKRATSMFFRFGFVFAISIHALVKRATL